MVNFKKIIQEARSKFKVIPKDLLKLVTREVEAGKSINPKGNHLVLPANGVYDYENQLVGVEWDGSGVQLRFVMSNGEKSNLQW